MGMTIDKAIKLMIRGSKYDYDDTPEEFCEAYDMSIEIMHKYQKIEEIISKWDVGIYNDEGLCDVEVLEMISSVIDGEVIEDGNEN